MQARSIAAAPLMLLLATSMTTGAQAAHQSIGLISEARGTAQTSDGVTISAGADVWFRNGALVGTPSAFGVGGAAADWDAGPFAAGATDVWATTLADAGPGRVATAASSSLSHGELKVMVDSAAILPFGSSGNAQAWFQDAIWFTNTSGHAQSFTLSMRVDGTISGSGTRAEGFSYVYLSSGGGGTCNTLGQCITPNPDGTGTTSFEIYGVIDQQESTPFRFRSGPFGPFDNDIPWWNFSFGPGHNPALGLYDYTKSLTLHVPTGETTLFLGGRFNMQICAGNRRCDFGNTSAIRFSDMPEGLSWTSQSGVFLSALGNGGGGGGGVIPEPRTWAMLIAGFGLVGTVARRRRPATVVDAP